MTGPDVPEHRQLRELLGAFALRGLEDDARAAVRAHLDGCATCRAELAEIAPLADDLRRVDPAVLSDVPEPPAGLGEAIRAGVARERELVRARERREQQRQRSGLRTRRLSAAAAAVTVVLAALGVGVGLGRSTAPTTVAQPPRPVEQVEVRALEPSVRTEQAAVIAHRWGVEAVFEGTGFVAGRTYRAAFRSTDGRLLPAGEFLGTGGDPLTCNLQSALLRDDTAGFVVVDDSGAQVLTADL